MSSERPVMRWMRRCVRPQGQGSGMTDVMSRVRYRKSGIASRQRVVSTNSPGWPSGTGSPVCGSMISSR